MDIYLLTFIPGVLKNWYAKKKRILLLKWQLKTTKT